MAEKFQQYPGTEYIQPPISPLTLDAKKSPLALLAQTCSAIGKDPSLSFPKSIGQHKLLLPNDLTKLPSNSFRKTSSTCSSPNSFHIPPASPALSDNKVEYKRLNKSPPKPLPQFRSTQEYIDLEKRRDLSNFQLNELQRKKSPSIENRKRKSVIQNEERERKMSKTDTVLYPTQNLPKSPSSSVPNRYNLSPTEFQRSLAESSIQSQNLLMSMHDSYCLACQTSHVRGSSCLHPLKLDGYPFNSLANAYPLYAHMLMSASRSSNSRIDSSQHICNWVTPGSGTCGKRFSSSEELSSHLRTHVPTSTQETTEANYFMNSLDKYASSPFAAAYMSHAAALAAAVTPLSNIMPSSVLTKSHSPVHGYNPFKTNMHSQFPNNLSSMPIAAGVGPYSSPYALYGHGLNHAAAAAAAGICYP